MQFLIVGWSVYWSVGYVCGPVMFALCYRPTTALLSCRPAAALPSLPPRPAAARTPHQPRPPASHYPTGIYIRTDQ